MFSEFLERDWPPEGPTLSFAPTSLSSARDILKLTSLYQHLNLIVCAPFLKGITNHKKDKTRNSSSINELVKINKMIYFIYAKSKSLCTFKFHKLIQT